MLREHSIQIAIEQRRQRRALIIFALALAVFIGFCGLFGVRLLMLQSPDIPAGKVTDYADQKQHRFEVPRLKTSTLIQRRDQTMSEDLIYVRHNSAGDWIALIDATSVEAVPKAAARITDNAAIKPLVVSQGIYRLLFDLGRSDLPAR